MNDTVDMKRLALAYYVVGALCVLASVIAPALLLRSLSTSASQMRQMIIFASLGGLAASLAMSGCLVATGVLLQKQQATTFCRIVSIVLCFAFPVGTILGMLTLRALRNDTTSVV